MSLILDRPNQKKKLARFCFPSIQNWICVNWKFDYFVSSEKVREREIESLSNEQTKILLIHWQNVLSWFFCLFAGYDNDDDSDGGGNRLSIEMFSRRISEIFFCSCGWMIGSISISKASSYIWRGFFFSTSFNWIVDDLFSISGSPSSSSSSFWTHQWMWLSLLNRIFSY